jgi:hypothetical protein
VRRGLSGPRWREYRELLLRARDEGYAAVSLEDWVLGGDTENGPILVLRHDVDQCPSSALAMAEIEEGLGIRSTWYFRWRTAHELVIDRLREAGCAVGLHYETLSRQAMSRRIRPGAELRGLIRECRGLLRREIAAFSERHGEIRSVCPHGDSRVPFVANGLLLRGQDCGQYGIEFDGNEAMRGKNLARWLTDPSRPAGGWEEGGSAASLLQERRSPILCVTHPNNWVSGAGLWVDNLLRVVLPDPAAQGPLRPIRSRGDEPPI